MYRFNLTGLAAVSLLAAPALHAQSSINTAPIIFHIHSIGIDSSRTEQLSHTLFDSLGPRLTGTPDLKRANDWLVSTYKSWGIDARNEKIGTWRGWRRGYSHRVPV